MGDRRSHPGVLDVVGARLVIDGIAVAARQAGAGRASSSAGRLAICLPGNPLAAMLAALVLLGPMVEGMLGRPLTRAAADPSRCGHPQSATGVAARAVRHRPRRVARSRPAGRTPGWCGASRWRTRSPSCRPAGHRRRTGCRLVASPGAALTLRRTERTPHDHARRLARGARRGTRLRHLARPDPRGPRPRTGCCARHPATGGAPLGVRRRLCRRVSPRRTARAGRDRRARGACSRPAWPDD